MFEQDQEIVAKLLEADVAFRALYRRHHQLNNDVGKVTAGRVARDDTTLGRLKKEKLLAKDQLTEMIDRYRAAHPHSGAPA